MRLSDQQVADLGRLAVDRCEHSLQSVTQLMDSGPQIYAVAVAVAASMVQGAADMLQDGMEHRTGTRPSDHAATGRVVADLLDVLGVEWKRSKSRTPSAGK